MANLKNSVELLRRELRKSKIKKSLDFQSLLAGNPNSFVDLYRHLFCEYSTAASSHLVEQGFDLFDTSDYKFMETIYRILRDEFNWRPQVNLSQFFSPGFSEKKLDMARSVCSRLRDLARQLGPPAVQKSVHTQAVLATVAGGAAPVFGNVKKASGSNGSVEMIEVPDDEQHRRHRRGGGSTASAPCSTNGSRPGHTRGSDGTVRWSQNEDGAEKWAAERLRNAEHVPAQGRPNRNRESSDCGDGERPEASGVAVIMGRISNQLDTILARVSLLETRMKSVEDKVIIGSNRHSTPTFIDPPLTNGMAAASRSRNISSGASSPAVPLTTATSIRPPLPSRRPGFFPAPTITGTMTSTLEPGAVLAQEHPFNLRPTAAATRSGGVNSVLDRIGDRDLPNARMETLLGNHQPSFSSASQVAATLPTRQYHQYGSDGDYLRLGRDVVPLTNGASSKVLQFQGGASDSVPYPNRPYSGLTTTAAASADQSGAGANSGAASYRAQADRIANLLSETQHLLAPSVGVAGNRS